MTADSDIYFNLFEFLKWCVRGGGSHSVLAPVTSSGMCSHMGVAGRR